MDSNVRDLREYRKKRKRKKRLIRFIVSVIILSVTLLLYLYKDSWLPFLEDAVYNIKVQVNSGRSHDTDFPVDLGTSSSFSIKKLDNKLAVLSDTYYYVYDMHGQSIFSSQHTMSNPVIRTADKRALIYDQGAFRFEVLTKYKKVYEKKLEDQIIYAQISDKGYVAVVTASDRYSSFLTVYNENGNKIFYTSSSQKIISVAFTPLSSGCIISTMSVEGGQLVTKVSRYSFDTESVLWQSEGLPVLGLDLEYTESGDILLVGDEASYCISSDNTVSDFLEYKAEMTDYYVKDDTFILSFSNDALRKYYAVVYRVGESPVILDAAEEIRNVYLAGEYAYCVTDNRLTTWSMSGTLLDSIELEYNYNDMVIFDNEAFLLGASFIDKYIVMT